MNYLMTAITLAEVTRTGVLAALPTATGFEKEGPLYDRVFGAYGTLHTAMAAVERKDCEFELSQASKLSDELDRLLTRLESSRYELAA